MKILLYLLFTCLTVWGKPLVLLGHFDPYDNYPSNNSQTIAEELLEKSKNRLDFEIKICPLRTVFDESFLQFEDCLNNLPEEPKLVLGLGESNCNFKIETMARNLDQTYGPDNNGNERNQSIIILGAPEAIGFTYPLTQMYCALSPVQRAKTEVSNNAGSFVCNNFAFQFSYQYPNLKFGFIHVPAHNCDKLQKRNEDTIENLQIMIEAGLKENTSIRLPVIKDDIEVLRKSVDRNSCLYDFYKRAKGIDEKSFWPLRVIR